MERGKANTIPALCRIVLGTTALAGAADVSALRDGCMWFARLSSYDHVVELTANQRGSGVLIGTSYGGNRGCILTAKHVLDGVDGSNQIYITYLKEGREYQIRGPKGPPGKPILVRCQR